MSNTQAGAQPSTELFASAAVSADAATAATRVVPTASMSVRVPWGDWIDQILEHEEPVIEAALTAGEDIALSAVPMGSLIKMFIGPRIITQYVPMAFAALKGVLEPLAVDVPTSNHLVSTVANLILANEPRFARFIGDELDPMIRTALGAFGIKVA